MELPVWIAVNEHDERRRHGASVIEDLALERGVVCLVHHLGSLGHRNTCVHSDRSETFYHGTNKIGWGGGIRTHE